MLKHAKVGPGRPVKIEGRRFASATVASKVTGVPLPAMYARLNSPTPAWSDWMYDDDKPTSYRKQVWKAPLPEWVVYRLTHLPTGKTYIGMTSNFGSRKAQHLHLLRNGKHLTSALMDLYTKDPDQGNWEWSGVIVATKEEAILNEQLGIDELVEKKLLLNTSLNGRAPIAHHMENEEYRENQRKRSREYALENPDAMSERGKKGLETRWKDRSSRRAWEGAGNPFAKKVKIDGVVYGSVKDAVKAVGICEKTIRTRANSDFHPNYTFDI